MTWSEEDYGERMLPVSNSRLERRIEELEERLEALEGLLTDILPVIEHYAEETSYGVPVVDDPRDFTPDPECCSPEEIAA